MKLYNYEIEPFGKFLLELELRGKESRMRTRLVKLLDERLKLINQEKLEIINTYAKKDENGEIEYQEINGQKMFKINDIENYKKEIEELMNEVFVIDETEERREMLTTVANAVLNCDMTFKGEKALQYDRWCEIVEGINYE
jgi:uncharacterized protein YnzC (UPF0291/DUF896 family)